MMEIHKKILLALSDNGEYMNDESVYFYKHIENETGLTRKVLKPAMDDLRAEGMVEHVRGLISEDGGGYYGSGFMITSKGFAVVKV